MFQLSTSKWIGARIGIYKIHLAIQRSNPWPLQLKIPLLRICPMTPVSSFLTSSLMWNSNVLIPWLFFFFVVSSFGYFYYMNVANFNSKWQIFVNGIWQNNYSSNSSGFSNCTYFKSSNATRYQVDVPQNVTVVALGSESSNKSSMWSLEVNMLL